MSGDFTYVWDAALHGVPETLEQANDLYNKFRKVAREQESEDVVRTPTLNNYGGELYDYYVEHELDQRNRPLIEDCCAGVIIIEDGLTFGSAQYYHAVQQAVKQGLVFFEVDANIVFLPDGRVLPEEEQAAWQALGRKLEEDATKPRDQVFPETEKELSNRLYATLEPFMQKYGFSKKYEEYFSIQKNASFGLVTSSVQTNINSLGLRFGLRFRVEYSIERYSSKSDVFLFGSFTNFKIEVVDFFVSLNDFFLKKLNIVIKSIRSILKQIK